MRTMAARHAALLLLACAALPAAVRAAGPVPTDLDDLTFPEFKALLRWESYASAGCAVQGGCQDECLKGGLEVYDKPAGDTTGASLYLLSKLDNPPNSDCRCPPAFGDLDAATNTFDGYYDGLELKLTADKGEILVSWAGCEHVYAVEESFDRDDDGKPDFLGDEGEVMDAITPAVSRAIANVISGTVAVTVFANVGSMVLEKLMSVASLEDIQSLAEGIDMEKVGEAGGALTPLIQQAQYLGIIGQTGGKGNVPAVVTRLSEGLSWTNFHLSALFANTTDSAPAVQARRNMMASGRRDMRRMGFRLQSGDITEADKCAKVEKSATELRSTMSTVAIAIASAFGTRIATHVRGILDLPDEDLVTQGRLTFAQFFGFTAVTLPTLTKGASKELAGSKEMPTVMKSFMGAGEAALEAAFSGCPKYLYGGIAVLVFLVLFFICLWYCINKTTEYTEYTRTGPQPAPTMFDTDFKQSEEDGVLELLPGQDYELQAPLPPPAEPYTSYGAPQVVNINGQTVPPVALEQFQRLYAPPGERVTGSAFGMAGMDTPLQNMAGAVDEMNAFSQLTNEDKAEYIMQQEKQVRQLQRQGDQVAARAARAALSMKKQALKLELGSGPGAQELLQKIRGESGNASCASVADAVNKKAAELLEDEIAKETALGNTATVEALQEELEELLEEGGGCSQVVRFLAMPVALPYMAYAMAKKALIKYIIYRTTQIVDKSKDDLPLLFAGSGEFKDPKPGDKFRGEFEEFANFGGYVPKDDPTAQAFLGRFKAVFRDQNAEKIYYQVWNFFMLALQAIFVKTITTPSLNAQANLGLKVVDLVLKFYLAPHVNKEAYVDDILAQILNVLQVGVLWQFIKDKTGGLVGRRRQGSIMQGLGGDMAARYFVGGALAGIIPPLVTAMYECVKSLFRLRRKTKKAAAKANDAKNDLEALKDPETAKKMIAKKILNSDHAKKAKSMFQEKTGLDDGTMGAFSDQKVEQIATLLVTDRGKEVFKAAKEFSTRYAMIRNKTFVPTDPRSSAKCLAQALQEVATDYEDCLKTTVNGEAGLLAILGVREDIDLSRIDIDMPDLANFVDIDPTIVKAITLCMEFDPEKGKEYMRKANLVLFKLPWPQDMIDAVKNYVLNIISNDTQNGPAKESGMMRIRIKTEGDDTYKYEDIAPGTKIHIKQAPLRPGIDFSERMYGAATFKGTGMSVLPGNAGHAEHEKLEAERFFTWTPEIQESPLDKAHVARSVVVDWNTEEYGATIKGEIDPGFRYMHNPGAPPRAPPPPTYGQPYMSPGIGPQFAAPNVMPMGMSSIQMYR